MGSRVNIGVKTAHGKKISEPGACVVFYGHWSGYEAPKDVRDALAKKWRWNYAPYLARIVFQTFCRGDVGETGFGISTDICDNEYPCLVLDPEDQTVYAFRKKDVRDGKVFNVEAGDAADPVKKWTFEEFSKIEFKNSDDDPWSELGVK